MVPHRAVTTRPRRRTTLSALALTPLSLTALALTALALAPTAAVAAPSVAVPSGVPGIQIDGYFPDDSTTNSNHGRHHDAQFVIRLPDRWNGGLVVAVRPATVSSTPTTGPSPGGTRA